jgi:hypothetical protein
MYSIISSHIKSQKNINLHEKRESTDTKTEITQMLELFDKDFSHKNALTVNKEQYRN